MENMNQRRGSYVQFRKKIEMMLCFIEKMSKQAIFVSVNSPGDSVQSL